MMLSLINEPETGSSSTVMKSSDRKTICRLSNVPNGRNHLPIKYVIYVFPNVRPQAQELAIDAMQGSL